MQNFDIDVASGKVAIQGNLDPKILLESKDVIKKESHKILNKFKDYPGYIFNLGHGMLPETNPDKVERLIKFYREY